MTTTSDSVAAHAGQPLRRSHPWIGVTAITMISASSRGPISHDAANIPATAITAAAAPSRITTPRGNEVVTGVTIDVVAAAAADGPQGAAASWSPAGGRASSSAMVSAPHVSVVLQDVDSRPGSRWLPGPGLAADPTVVRDVVRVLTPAG